MARHYEARNLATRRYRLGVIFLPNGTGTPTYVASPGLVSVARTGTGIFRITLRDSYLALDSFSVSMMMDGASSNVAELQSEDVNGTTPYVDVAIKNANTAAYVDLNANANRRVSVSLWLRDTTSD